MTHGVVTPNIVAPIRDFPVAAGGRTFTMPAMAAAALARIREETAFIPEMSTTEGIIVTSATPTYGRVSPEATVDTSSFGTPTGKLFMAAAAMAEPPDPPRASTP